jgi:hypothetical protein
MAATKQSGVGGHTAEPGGLNLEQAYVIAEHLTGLGFDVTIHASPGRSEPVRPPDRQEVPFVQASVHVPTTRWTSIELGRFSTWLDGRDDVSALSYGEGFVLGPARQPSA